MVEVCYNKNVTKALLNVFQDINLDQSLLWTPGMTLSRSLFFFSYILLISLFYYYCPEWHEQSRRRQFFEDFAGDNNFDPLDPNNWYSQLRSNIMANKVHH